MSGNVVFRQEEIELLKNAVGHRGKLIFAMICGSAAFNLNLPTSDIDYMGVYIGNNQGPLKKLKNGGTLDKHDPDYQIYEASVYCELLVKGNPKVVEPLFTDKLCWSSQEWEELKKLRKVVLNQTTIKQYFGFANVQLKDIEKGKGVPTKKLYHTYRLLKESKRIVDGQEPHVFLEGPEHDFIMKIRADDVDREALMKEIAELKEYINARLSNIPESADKSVLTEWLTPMLLKGLKDAPQKPIKYERGTGYEDLVKRAEDLLKKNGIKGSILYIAESGSNAFGLECSEKDYFGVYAVNPLEVINPLNKTVTTVFDETLSSGEPNKGKYKRGMQLHEVTAVARVLSKGSNRAVEAFYQDPERTWTSSPWKVLRAAVAEKGGLLTPALVFQYLGLAKACCIAGQRAKDEFPRYLCMAQRFMMQAKRVVKGQVPSTNWLSSEELQLLKDIKAGKIDMMGRSDAILKDIKVLQAGLKGASSLPKIDPTDVLNDWVLSLYKGML